MRHRRVRRLKIARETLGRLEADRLQGVAAGATGRACPTNQDSVCICETDLCITLAYTNCNLCVG